MLQLWMQLISALLAARAVAGKPLDLHTYAHEYVSYRIITDVINVNIISVIA